jgi:GTP-binding protein Era
VLNKVDAADKETIEKAKDFFSDKKYCKQVVVVSALKKKGLKELLDVIISLLPDGEPFYQDDNLSDLPMKFFVGEMIREKIFYLYQDEIPYHATVLVQEFKEKTTLTKISADIILQRETQKGIVLGEGGKMIKELGTQARKDIEEFIGRKVFLELFVKVRPKWRDNEIQLREYGY